MIGGPTGERAVLQLRRLERRKMGPYQPHGVIVVDADRGGPLEGLVRVQQVVARIAALIDPETVHARAFPPLTPGGPFSRGGRCWPAEDG